MYGVPAKQQRERSAMTEEDHQFMEADAARGSITRVGIAIVQRGQTVLVGVRDAQAVLGGKHEFPGGKCFPQEDPAACAIRECREETGLEILPGTLLTRLDHQYDHGRLQLSFYLCQLADESQSDPHLPFAWTKIELLSTLDFPAANRQAIGRLLESLPDNFPATMPDC